MMRRARRIALAFSAIVMIASADGVYATAGAVQQTPPRDPLRARIETRYEIIPLRDAIGLRPKSRGAGIRMIEVSDEGISIDGSPVSGRELRDRVGSDADSIIQLSYLDPPRRREFLGIADRVVPPAGPPPAEAPAPPRVQEPPLPTAPERDRSRPRRQRVGDRVRVMGSVTVPRDESVDGQVVAVLGSVRIDGSVTDQVVAVLGSVDLGPEASVDGDVVAVGGRVNRAEGARIRGRVTEVNLPREAVVGGLPWRRGPFTLGAFSGTSRLFGTLFRLFVLGLLGSIVVLMLRQPVERISDRVRSEPVKMALIGLLAQLLFLPALILSVIILALSIIGIPLLVFVPFVVVAVLFVLLGGFTGTAYLLGGWAAGRAGMVDDQPYARVWLGVVLILAPLLAARLFGLIGGPFHLAAVMIASFAILLEYMAWTTGFGAALTTTFENWRSRRSLAPAATPPP
jgi:hypothetical protein